jgi:hypothetical protein
MYAIPAADYSVADVPTLARMAAEGDAAAEQELRTRGVLPNGTE